MRQVYCGAIMWGCGIYAVTIVLGLLGGLYVLLTGGN